MVGERSGHPIQEGAKSVRNFGSLIWSFCWRNRSNGVSKSGIRWLTRFLAYLFVRSFPENKQKLARPRVEVRDETNSAPRRMHDYWIGCIFSDKLISLNILKTEENLFWNDKAGDGVFSWSVDINVEINLAWLFRSKLADSGIWRESYRRPQESFGGIPIGGMTSWQMAS
jgi:hypothetical protein